MHILNWEPVLAIITVVFSIAAAFFGLKYKLNSMHQEISALVEMHENPEKTGFGTIGHKDAFEANTKAINNLTHYLKWFIERQTKEVPPPPIDP